MSLALYRKYRPATFAEVIGQEHVTEPICQALLSGRIHHAYLFSGPRGCGKTSSARILARSLNCEKGPTPTPCGVCDSCVALAPNGPGSLDVIEIDAASHGLVDDARDLRERAFFAPVSSRFKIYVIDEAHMITNAAFNALLKVVEEPPPHVKFIFATTEPDKVLVTIKSRTFHYRFRLIPPQIMREHLAGLCEREGITVEPAVLPLIVRAGAGSARDAQSILDQLSAGSGEGGITYDRALSLLGYTDAALLEEVVDAFAAGDGAAVFRAVDRVIEAGLEPRRFVQDLLERFRDLLVLDAVPDAADTGLLDAPADQLERMRSQASRYGRPSLSRAADVMATALVEMRGTTSPRLVLELACARVLLPGAASDTPALLARLDQLERRFSATAPVELATEVGTAAVTAATAPPVVAPVETRRPAEPAPSEEIADPGASRLVTPEPDSEVEPEVAPGAPAATEPEPPPPIPGASGVLDVVALGRLWEAVLEAVKQRSRTAHALMFSSQIESLEGKTLTLSFPTPTLAARFANDVADFVVEALREVVGVELVIRTTSASRPSGGPSGVGPSGTGPSGSAPSGSAPSSGPSAGSGGGPRDAGQAASPSAPASDSSSLRSVEPEPDEVDEAADEALPPPPDPADAALDLLKKEVGAQVIGEIDRS
jgi:DNA polymerase-3 subunit gamma/tau